MGKLNFNRIEHQVNEFVNILKRPTLISAAAIDNLNGVSLLLLLKQGDR